MNATPAQPLASFYASPPTGRDRPRFQIDIFPNAECTGLEYRYCGDLVDLQPFHPYEDASGERMRPIWLEIVDEDGRLYDVLVEEESYRPAMDHALRIFCG